MVLPIEYTEVTAVARDQGWIADIEWVVREGQACFYTQSLKLT